jgi:DNA-binding PucR family transcriptional regulator
VTSVQTVDLGSLAAALAPRAAAMVDEMVEMLLAQIDELRGDEQVIGRLRASIEANVSTLLHLLEQQMDIRLVDPPAGAVQWSLQLAQRGIPLSVLWRAYHLCTARYFLVCIEELTSTSESAQQLGDRIAAASTLINTYIDHVCARIGADYEAERQRWLRQRDALRAERIAELLAGRVEDRPRVEAALGYRLTGRHLGVILWEVAAPESTGVVRPQRVVNALADRVGCREQPLVVARDQATMWAWLSMMGREGPEDLDVPATLAGLLDGAGSTLRGAVGEVCTAVEGFGRTHRQAVVAQSVALAAGSSAATVTPYTAVSGLGFLCSDLARAREWVREVLGPLAVDDQAHGRLRESVGAFLETGGSLSAAAERLGCHKNTVQYRIRRAEEMLGRSTRERRVDTELALQACRWLRGAVLTEAEHA